MEQDIQEYPKALYRNGAYMEVKNETDEAAARDDGWTDWHTDHESTKAADEEAGVAGLDREKLKTMAKSLGLEFPNFIKTEQLAKMVAEAVKTGE